MRGGDAEHYNFAGKYLGSAIDRGTNASGVHNFDVINSVEGSAHEHLLARPPERIVTTHLEFPATKISGVETGGTIPAFGPPIYPRRGLGAKFLSPEAPNSYYYGEIGSESERARERSPRLRENPEAELDPTVELPWYRQQVESIKGREYLDEIDHSIDDEELLAQLSPQTRAIVTIPVAAATESDNIFNTLSEYAQQPEDSLNQTTIFLHLNWVDDAKDNPETAAKINKTIAEIERAKKAFPNLKIAVSSYEFKRQEVGNRPLIGLVARRMLDTALMSLERAIREGRSDGNVLLIRNDADEKGMDHKYLANILKNAGQSPDVDAFVGNLRWQTELFKDYPGFGIVSNLLQGMQSLANRDQYHAEVGTSGANTTVRAVMLAAVGGLGNGEETGAGTDDIEIRRRIYSARSGGTSESSGYGSSYNRQSGRRTTRKPIKMVFGSTIDTDGSRLLRSYLSPDGIIAPWKDFGEGGYKARPEIDNDTPENANADIETIAKRVETNVEALFNSWYASEFARARSALALMWGVSDRQGRQIYELSWKGGVAHFKFTDSGKVWLKNRLLRDQLGRFDPFYRRTRRHKYNENNNGQKQPLTHPAAFVQPQAA